MVQINIENVTKKFEKKNKVTMALQHINLDIDSGEFFGILGSSGSGKTTLMRIIAGLEIPTEGTVSFDQKPVSKDNKIITEVEDRNIGMVFQNWALYPHLTNFENIAFPLRIMRLKESAVNRRVKEIAELLDISEVLNKHPKEASGGQQQRVAYARALVKNPALLLLDEPFSNLDATIKDVARKYTKELQNILGFTAIIVSHDPADIFSLSRQVGVINKSLIMQTGKPIDVFTDPVSIEVARSTGEYNTILVNVKENGLRYNLSVGNMLNMDIDISKVKKSDTIEYPAGEVLLGFRPSDVIVIPSDMAGSSDLPRGFKECGEAEVAISSYYQGSFRVTLSFKDSSESFFCFHNTPLQPGEKVNIYLNPDLIHLFNAKTNKIIF
ncbi:MULTISPECIES: glucose ABC transporter ATP-binding protein GlcV [Ferroplasma]|jgi:glucose/arabinose transport system ATP-binding protein|uniref:Molybdate/tungstate import ATP-binding protein WtpC n=1 Tax=Ferroplasma acidarmanus Fer1 TaxID=333146 RepID=S0APU6_FERAC|nr:MULTISPECIES: glucose ABC transporter ATP-binding protein GlcV [Ferroplasma]AGO60085.1 hypothetical protein FACI_IFERC00001G0105 [Ferroplasma acidarmanus Fer1]WMT53850.1 MAG: glucose ABC transporter ATP-binding protein GlcV [Ferroplasma acidiphilum]